MQYKHTPHSVQLVSHHAVFAPRYRRQLLVGERKKRLAEGGVARDNGWKIVALEVMPDHAHLFVSADTSRTKPEIVVKRFRGRSSHVLRAESELLKMPTLWTRSYFLSMTGNMSSGTIQEHVENQRGKF